MKKIDLKHYETPAIEVVKVEVEKGFATSGWGASDWDEGHHNWLNE